LIPCIDPVVDAGLIRNSLKLAIAALITAAIAVHAERVEFLWYPLLAVVIVVDDNDDHTVQAAVNRLLGTAMGGLITILVHSVLSGWIGVLVSLLLMIPVLQALGWQSAMGTAGLVSVMFLMIPHYTALNWDYLFNRGLDTLLGCVVAIAVGLLFWPRNAYAEMKLADGRLRSRLQAQLQHYTDWLEQGRPRPSPLDPAPLSSDLQRLEHLVERERAGPRHRNLRRSKWEQRLRLWQLTHFHWLAWERLLADLPDQPIQHEQPLLQAVRGLGQQLAGEPGPTPARNPQLWQQLARRQHLPLLLLLALAEEWRPLHACLGGVRRLEPPP
jgi:hypothetical protein